MARTKLREKAAEPDTTNETSGRGEVIDLQEQRPASDDSDWEDEEDVVEVDSAAEESVTEGSMMNSAAHTPSFMNSIAGTVGEQTGSMLPEETTEQKSLSPEQLRKSIRQRRDTMKRQTNQRVGPATTGKGERVGGKKRVGKDSFKHYIHKVMKEVHPELRLDKRSMDVMDSMVLDMFDRLAREASSLLTYGNHRTITLNPHQVKTAVKLILPGDLAEHAIQEADKAVAQIKMERPAEENQA